MCRFFGCFILDTLAAISVGALERILFIAGVARHLHSILSCNNIHSKLKILDNDAMVVPLAQELPRSVHAVTFTGTDDIMFARDGMPLNMVGVGLHALASVEYKLWAYSTTRGMRKQLSLYYNRNLIMVMPII